MESFPYPPRTLDEGSAAARRIANGSRRWAAVARGCPLGPMPILIADRVKMLGRRRSLRPGLSRSYGRRTAPAGR